MTQTKRYLPSNDYLFRKIVGSDQHPEITKGIISDLLGIQIESLTVLNPFDIEWYRKQDVTQLSLQETIVDVLVRLKDNTLVIIEVQTGIQRYFVERIFYYTTKRSIDEYGNHELMRTQIGSDQKYSAIHPTFGISILDFILFNTDDDPLHEFSFFDIQHGYYLNPKDYRSKDGQLFGLTFLELGKPVENTSKNIRYLIEFFKGNKLEVDAPDYLKEALEMTEVQNLSAEERDMIFRADIAREDRKGQLLYAKEEGQREGREIGLIEGRKAVAKAALRKGLGLDDIAEITGLDLTTLLRLESESK